MDTQFLSEDLIDHLIEHSTGDQSAKERRQKRREERRKPSSVGGVFSRSISLPEMVLPFLNGKTFNLGENCQIVFPSLVQMECQGPGKIRFSTKPQVIVQKIIEIQVDISGVNISLEQIDVLLDGFPDFHIHLGWK
jgi:hypothetical protein